MAGTDARCDRPRDRDRRPERCVRDDLQGALRVRLQHGVVAVGGERATAIVADAERHHADVAARVHVVLGLAETRRGRPRDNRGDVDIPDVVVARGDGGEREHVHVADVVRARRQGREGRDVHVADVVVARGDRVDRDRGHRDDVHVADVVVAGRDRGHIDVADVVVARRQGREGQHIDVADVVRARGEVGGHGAVDGDRAAAIVDRDGGAAVRDGDGAGDDEGVACEARARDRVLGAVDELYELVVRPGDAVGRRDVVSAGAVVDGDVVVSHGALHFCTP